MSETLEYIEAYFEQGLSNAERQVFEERCVHDEDFAKDVAFYVMSREAIKEKLLEQKKQQWEGYEHNRTETAATAANPAKPIFLRKWIPYAAAACLLLVVSLVHFFTSSQGPRRFADNYINNNYKQLSQNMDASMDSLQQGIAAYNKEDYNKALLLFNKVYEAHNDNGDAKKYLGLTYLAKKDYDEALIHFDELAQKKGLFSNPGLFLKALTLLERNKGNDKDEAKKLLQQVVSNRLDDSKEAEELLTKW